MQENRAEEEKHEEFRPNDVEEGLNEVELYQGKRQFTDVGNAELFAEENGYNIRYCFIWNKWLLWNEKRWEIDQTDKIYQLAKKTIRQFYLKASLEEDNGKRKSIIQHALRSENRRKITDMIELAKSEYGIPVLPENLDRDHYLLKTNNGTIDLKTGKLLDHNRDDFITKSTNVDYDMNSECPKWLDFLEIVTKGDDSLIKFLQKAIGYSISGDTSEQVWFLLYGAGANGKSTFLNTIRMVLNDYAMNTPTETFMVKHGEQISNDIARLKSARFVTAFESSEGRKLNESIIKQMTGGDIISARFLYGEYFDYTPNFKIWFSTNHKPEITGTDLATWRRVRLIPFTVTIEEEKCIKDYWKVLFKEEAEGILNWMVEGFALWQFEGLKVPGEIKKATENYKEEMDDLNNFLDDYCIVWENERIDEIEKEKIDKYFLNDNKIPFIKASTLHGRWCELIGSRISQKAFSRKLRERGFFTHKLREGHYWIGIGMIDDSEL